MNDLYDSTWGNAKLGKLWIHAKDLLENGKQPLLPAPSFYSNWNGTIKDLASMASKILKYLKYKPPWILRVDFSYDIDAPGLFILKDGSAKIIVHGKYKRNSTACAAILAHELTHLVLNSKNCREEEELENERFTDFATVYLGLGVLVLNGKHRSHTIDFISVLTFVVGFLVGFFSNPIKKAENSFGYFEEHDYYTLFVGYLIKNNLDWDNVSQYIKKGTKYAGLSN